jgi:pantoate kinase
MSVNQLGTVAHLAEIANGTGLGTVGPLLTGGFVITKKSGGPGIAVIDRLSVSPRLKVVSACFGPIPTKTILRSESLRRKVNELGSSTIRSILKDPRPRSFMKASKAFAYGLGLMTGQTAQLVELMEGSGAIGATQNMLGQAAHAVAEEDIADSVLAKVKKRFPKTLAFTCDLDFAGARIL